MMAQLDQADIGELEVEQGRCHKTRGADPGNRLVGLRLAEQQGRQRGGIDDLNDHRGLRG